MAWQRRQFLQGLGVLSLGMALPQTVWAHTGPLLLSCARQGDSDYLVAHTLQGKQVSQFKLPHRGHGLAPIPAKFATQQVASSLVFGRRPGRYIAHVNCLDGQLIDQYMYPEDRHCYGHGTFDVRGNLYVCEGVSASSQGVIGLYQLQHGKLKRQGEWLLPAVGPHEIIVHPDQRHLIVAVGGIHTHGRNKLNLDTMQPALFYLSLSTGQIRQSVHIPAHQLSIRHLAATRQGDVVFACQDQAADNEMLPLLYRHRLGDTKAAPLQAEPEQWLRFAQYVGSVAIFEQQVWASSPRGDCVACWNVRSGKMLSQTAMADACGLTASTQGVSVSAGNGQLRHQQTWQTPWHFDNHMAQWG
ncbi:DUF1513 domain-containing protein [Motilimonas pumila]|uniref:DUF1513 domain-containing protein n=1 Tax=Motilimonas pumila TaxID=2303987 RepID=A0A418YDQ1_9GAMM|nr:DUF1513 domain-containing protein [Motilimonas pumila]RJG42610.1 DUF1513 domain-containing protein [Motilimonas pumila]